MNLNVKRLILGGLAAGVVVFLITGVVNGAILSGDFENWMRGMGSLIHPPAQGISMSLWTLMSLIYGFVGVWIYAGIRPRYGAGPGTALRAGFALWIAAKLTVALDLIALGILPGQLIAGQLVGGFVAILAGVLVGAWVYRE